MKTAGRGTRATVIRSESNLSFLITNTKGRVCRMNLEQATGLIQNALVLALMVSGPMLCIGLVVGVLVSLFQAVTQIQEQTLTFIPKITAMVAAAILLMPWISQRLIAYTTVAFAFKH